MFICADLILCPNTVITPLIMSERSLQEVNKSEYIDKLFHLSVNQSYSHRRLCEPGDI